MIIKKNLSYYVVIKTKTIGGETKKHWVAAGRNYRDAQKLERRLLAERDDGNQMFTRNTAPTVEAYLTEWLDTAIKPPTRSLGTYEHYRFCLSHIIPVIGKVRLDKLTSIQITKLYKQLQAEGLSVTSVRMVHRTLRSAFNKAIKWNLLTKNPCLAADVPADDPSPAIALDRDQAMALLHQSEQHGTYDNLIIALGMLCGLRDSESCGLRWQDYDAEEGKLYIRHNLSERYADHIDLSLYEYAKPNGAKVLVLDKPKTESSENFLVIPKYVRTILKRAHLLYATKQLHMGPAFHNDDFILCNDVGIPYTPHKIYYVVQKVCKAYNKNHPDNPLPKIRAHDLRHTAATLLLEENIDIKYVSRQLRHSTTVITQNLYQHVTDTMAEKTAHAMDNIIANKAVK